MSIEKSVPDKPKNNFGVDPYYFGFAGTLFIDVPYFLNSSANALNAGIEFLMLLKFTQ